MRPQSLNDMRERLEDPENQHYLAMFFEALRKMIEWEKEREQAEGEETSNGRGRLQGGTGTGELAGLRIQTNGEAGRDEAGL